MAFPRYLWNGQPIDSRISRLRAQIVQSLLLGAQVSVKSVGNLDLRQRVLGLLGAEHLPPSHPSSGVPLKLHPNSG